MAGVASAWARQGDLVSDGTTESEGFTSGYKITQTLYTDCGFAQLKQLTSDFLAEIDWYTDGEGPRWMRRHPIMLHWRKLRVDDRVGVIIFRNRIDASSSGGVAIALKHLRRDLQLRRISRSHIPACVRRRFRSFPNTVTFDVHHSWQSEAYWVVRGLGARLARRGYRAHIKSLDDEAFLVKTDPLLTYEERFDRFADWMERRAATSALQHAREIVKRHLQGRWKELTPNTGAFLVQAQFGYDEVESMGALMMDASPPLVMFARALENEIARRIFVPFRAFFRASYVLPPSEQAHGQLRRIADFVSAVDMHAPELGTAGFFIRYCASVPKGKHVLTDAFTAFCSQLSDPSFLLSTNGLGYLLRDLAVARNKGAHPALVSVTELRDFVELVYGNQELQSSGVFARLIDATRRKGVTR